MVLANFAIRIGYQALITLQLPTGSVPFGALTAVEGAQHDEINTGIVGDDGQVYMSGLPERGTLNVNWGREKQQQCRASFDLSKLPKPTANNPIRSLAVRYE
ncbi:MAG: FimD/PapC C-terminal domain-containing protein [Symbiopectobacterium sp.]|uniref:FimD/PapC C-terminal domain-containing protein n=1 Tax=Symbiopectobacterium sp. TaxID=2952789 RepID=UPI0039E9D5EA